MGHKSRKQKKKFDDCEHIGFGKYCHECKKLSKLKRVEKN